MALQHIDSGFARTVCEEHKRPTLLNNILSDAVETLRENNEKLSIKVDAGSEELPIHVYDVHVIDVICRLVSNALKFGGAEEQVELIASRVGDEAHLTIRDHGPGMSEKLFEEARQAFRQIDREKLEQQGCGVGLSIVCYYTEMNGGRVHLSRPEGGGLQVLLSFPLCSEGAD